MLGDTAVAVNPEDARYQKLVGKDLQLPLTGRVIPLIADAFVDAAFGSGCVKITPAHDFNDYEIGLRHNLPQINIFTPARPQRKRTAALSRARRFVARERIVAELKAAGLVERIEKHRLMIRAATEAAPSSSPTSPISGT